MKNSQKNIVLYHSDKKNSVQKKYVASYDPYKKNRQTKSILHLHKRIVEEEVVGCTLSHSPQSTQP